MRHVFVAVLLSVVSFASPALASPGVTVPSPSTLALLAVGGGVAGAIALGRRWRKRRERSGRNDVGR